MAKRIPLLDRMSTKYTVNESGCWVWTAARNAYGYGVIGLPEGGTSLAHRAMYRELRSAIPDGLDLDHRCRNRACVNPDHLEAVTRRVNLLRGEGETAKNAAKTHCPKGHAYEGGNVIRRPSKPDARRCRTCDLARKRRDREKAWLAPSST